MSKPKVYLETSFLRYLVATPSRDEVKRRRQMISRLWWEGSRHDYELRVSEMVYDEFFDIRPGKISDEEAAARLGLIEQATLLHVGEAITELAGLLLEPGGPLPRSAEADAVHWAIAAHFQCEFVLTWNFKQPEQRSDQAPRGKDH